MIYSSEDWTHNRHVTVTLLWPCAVMCEAAVPQKFCYIIFFYMNFIIYILSMVRIVTTNVYSLEISCFWTRSFSCFNIWWNFNKFLLFLHLALSGLLNFSRGTDCDSSEVSSDFSFTFLVISTAQTYFNVRNITNLTFELRCGPALLIVDFFKPLLKN